MSRFFLKTGSRRTSALSSIRASAVKSALVDSSPSDVGGSSGSSGGTPNNQRTIRVTNRVVDGMINRIAGMNRKQFRKSFHRTRLQRQVSRVTKFIRAEQYGRSIPAVNLVRIRVNGCESGEKADRNDYVQGCRQQQILTDNADRILKLISELI